MKHRLRNTVAYLLLIIMILASSTPVYAYDPADGAFPNIEEVFGKANKNPYLSEYRNNYYLDMKEMSTLESIKNIEATFNSVANLLLKLQMYFARFLITIIYYSFEIDLYSIFSSLINSVVKEMRIALFDELSLIAIVLLGIYYLVKIIANQKTQVWVAIIQTVLLITLAVGFFNNPTGLLRRVDDLSKDISRSVLTGTYKSSNQGNTPETAVIAVSNDVWMMFVHKPWQVLQFGSIEVAAKEEQRILSLTPKSTERQQIINELAKDDKIFTADWGIKRVGFILLYFIPMLVMGIIIGVLSLLILGYQFLTIFYTLMGVFVFIIALIPFFGIKVIGNWISKIIANGFIKAIISFVLAIIFACNAALFNLIGVYGWFIVLILQITLMAVIVWKRKDFIEMITNIRRTVQQGNINKNSKQDINLESKLAGSMGFRRKNKNKNKFDYDNYEEVETPSGTRRMRIADDVEGDKKQSSKLQDTAITTTGGTVEMQLAENGEVSNLNTNLKSLIKKAEELLEKKYEDEKQEEEERAKKLKKEPEYSRFVKKAQTRETLGENKFEKRQLYDVAKLIERVENAGGSSEDVYKSISKKEGEVTRPKNLESIEVQVLGDQQNLDKQEAFKILEAKESEEYAKEFNQQYDKQYDKAFFEELFNKYGKENVRSMMDRMKSVEKKEGTEIKNPAGYLTTGLKKNQRDKVKYQENQENQENNKTLQSQHKPQFKPTEQLSKLKLEEEKTDGKS